MSVQIQLRRDTSNNWTVNNPLLAIGETGIETDTTYTKSGDGVSSWNSLHYNTAKSSTTASYALTASVALNATVPISVPSSSWVSASNFITLAQTASYVTASNIFGTIASASYAPPQLYSNTFSNPNGNLTPFNPTQAAIFYQDSTTNTWYWSVTSGSWYQFSN